MTHGQEEISFGISGGLSLERKLRGDLAELDQMTHGLNVSKDDGGSRRK